MRIEGTLTKWNDDRGFGFVTPDNGGSEIFVHVSAFPRDGQRPTVGERLSFEIELDKEGKKRATKLVCPGRSRTPRPTQRQGVRGERKRSGFLQPVLVMLLLGVVAAYGYDAFSKRAGSTGGETMEPALSAQAEPAGAFRCDGRTHCSQMTSCAEATYFLRNCPGVKMDGNNDGVPCEQQWCSGSSTFR